MLYAKIGRDQEAQELFSRSTKGWPDALKTVLWFMSNFPFTDHQVAERIAGGYAKAGCTGEPSDFYKISKLNRLSGSKIKSLFFGRKVTGIDLTTGNKWWVDRSQDGNSSIREGEKVDNGKSWIEHDMLCDRWDSLYEGLKDCWVIYRNPEGTPDNKDEYLGAPGYGIFPFSAIE